MPRLLHRHIVRLKVKTLTYICASRQIYMAVCTVHIHVCTSMYVCLCISHIVSSIPPLLGTARLSSVQLYIASPCLIHLCICTLYTVCVYDYMHTSNSSSNNFFRIFSGRNQNQSKCENNGLSVRDKMKREKYAAKTMLTTTMATITTRQRQQYHTNHQLELILFNTLASYIALPIH